jgi:sulfate transport system permease protein
MAAIPQRKLAAGQRKSQRGTEEAPFVKWLLITVALLFSLVFLLLPLVNVFA